MTQAHSTEFVAQKFRRDLERLLGELFAPDPDDLRRLIQKTYPEVVPHILWRGPARKVAEDTCDYFARTLGLWPMIYRLTTALLQEYAKNPAVAELHRRLCASAFAGPLTASYATREQAVRDFISRHFAEYEDLREYDQRGAVDPEKIPKHYGEADFLTAASYFAALERGLSEAHTCTMSSNRLDVYAYILEGALDYRACSGLFLHIRRALATPAMMKEHAGRVLPVLALVEEAFCEHLEAGLWPPVDHRVCNNLLGELPDLEALPLDARQRGIVESFLATIRAITLLEGLGFDERALIDRISDELPRFVPWLRPRLDALLRYRQCLAFVYCGDWAALRHQLEHPPAQWDLNWSGFLWYELGEFRRSLDCYEQSCKTSAAPSIHRAISLRSLRALVGIAHPTVVPKPLPADPEAAQKIIHKAMKASEAARKLRRAELDHGIVDERCHLPAAQSLFDASVMRGLAEEFSRVARNALSAAELRASGRGDFFGGNTSGPLMKTYHALWLCGIPALQLRLDAATELVQAALRTNSLSHVLEAAHVTCAVVAWDGDRLADAAAVYVARKGTDAWRELLASQVQLLRRCIEELNAQDVFSSASEHVVAHPVDTRLRSLISFFGELATYLPDAVLAEAGEMVAGVLCELGSPTGHFRSLIEASLEFVLDAWARLPGMTGGWGVTPEVLARALATSEEFSMGLSAALNPVWPSLSDDYRRDFIAAFCREVAEWPGEIIEARFGAEDTPLRSRVEHFFSPLVDQHPMPLLAHLRDVARHWSEWRRHGYGVVLFSLVLPASTHDFDVDACWQTWRPEILRALDDERLTRVVPMARNWIEEGIYSLSSLALRFGDVRLWTALFEQIRPWPAPRLGFSDDLTPVRRAIEDEREGDLRRRLCRRLLSADSGDEWAAVVQVFCYTFKVATRVLIEDVEILRSFWERTRLRDFSAIQVYQCLRIIVERLSDEEPVTNAALWEHLEFMLMHAPRKIQKSAFLSYWLRRNVAELCTAVAASERTRGTSYRDEWLQLREWLDALAR